MELAITYRIQFGGRPTHGKFSTSRSFLFAIIKKNRYFFFRYSRLLSPRYGDGYSSPTISITGQELPNSRLVSLVAFGEADVADPQFTLVNMQWGQIMTHDMSMLAGSTQSSKKII